MGSQTYSDIGQCIPERAATLALQQAQLLAGKRDVQMFPVGTTELPTPIGFARHENARGVFHYRSNAISAEVIEALSEQGRENEFLMLGPISKAEVAKRILAGETLLSLTEYTPDGIEVRSAAGTNKTINEQHNYFERTKEPGNAIVVDAMEHVIAARLAELN
ncbi:hypothetical protein [Bradyrhizobium sp. CCBAU 51627]|uniref:hypothetical protein n=1 Tax=Bradyrhizobium sp. CCBAU 51627 TaxID=1325088 RepID=UPI002306D50D|nr:hypothetical protein [Bradyrhizobium sp. CCBAU 51627]MDA9437253.1 hypothetical protein [Bradyrhizobium sp. CCBAU 51627]